MSLKKVAKAPDDIARVLADVGLDLRPPQPRGWRAPPIARLEFLGAREIDEDWAMRLDVTSSSG